MKYLIAGSIALAIVLLGCLKTYNDTYVVINDTSKQVRIEAYVVESAKKYNEIPYLEEVIDIQPNSKFIIRKGKGEEYQPRGIFKFEIIDSVNIIFSNQRIIRYKCNNVVDLVFICNDKRNIINYNEYYDRSCGKHECTHTYTITEADFESAEIVK